MLMFISLMYQQEEWINADREGNVGIFVKAVAHCIFGLIMSLNFILQVQLVNILLLTRANFALTKREGYI